MDLVTKRVSIFLSLALLSMFSLHPNTVSAQEVVIESADGRSMGMMAIPGGLIILEGEEGALVRRRIVASATDETPDIQENDRIIFLDGTRISSVNQFNNLYHGIAVGDEVKVGIQRGEAKMIRSFIKQEMQDSYSSNSDGATMQFQFSTSGSGGVADLENRSMWPAGFLVGERDGKVVVGTSLPLPNKPESLAAIKTDDVIISLNDTLIKSASQLLAAYEKINVGDDVTVTYQQAGETQKAMFKKQEPPQMRMEVRSN